MVKGKQRILGVLVARQSSSRLPGKAMVDVVGMPMIGHLIDRMQGASRLDDIVIATSSLDDDLPIAQYGASRGVKVFRGNPEDVLDRVYHAALEYGADAIVEVGGDCPFVTPALLDWGVEQYLATGADLVSNSIVPPFTLPVGYDVIVVKFSALKIAHETARLQSERFQPFQFIAKHPEKFTSVCLSKHPSFNHWRWTLDYPEDLQFVREIYRRLLPKNRMFGFEEIRKLLTKEPGLIDINSKYSEPVQDVAVWYTGSYVKEVHNDMRNLLEQAAGSERDRRWSDNIKHYEHIRQLCEDLVSRSRKFMEQKDA